MLMGQLNRLPLWAHGAATVAAFGIWQGVRIRLDALYAQSKHPVDYATGQTTFDADRIKEFYAHMAGEGTLDIYVATQRFDFLFMLMIAVFGVLLGTLIARVVAPSVWGKRMALGAAGLAVVGAVFDAMENGVSFVMLADPAGFAPWLALVYSGFAAAKFVVLTGAMAAALIGCGFAVGARFSRRG